MTTYAYVHAADAHLFPARPNHKSMIAPVIGVLSQIRKAMARAKARRVLHSLPDHLLKDIGVERHTIDW